MAEQYCDRVFLPLEDWERPPRFAAGSGRALENPFRHLRRALMESTSLPWPLAGHPTGFRQNQLVPPQRRRELEEQPLAAPLFHRLSNSFRIRNSSRRVDNQDSGSSTGVTLYDMSFRDEVPAMVQLDGYKSTVSA